MARTIVANPFSSFISASTSSWAGFGRHRAWLGLLVVTGILYAFLVPYYYIGMFGDDATYVLGAQSLLKGSYIALYHLGESTRPIYPPGFSLFLAPFLALSGSHFQWLKWVPLLLMLLDGALLFFLARAWMDHGLSLFVMAIFLLNPATLYSSCLVMSEPLLITLFLLTFLLLRRMIRVVNSWEPWVMGGLLGYAAIVRYTGIVLTLAVIVGLLSAKRRRAALYCLLVSISIAGAVIFRNYEATHQFTGYSTPWRITVSEITQPFAFVVQWLRATHMIFVNDLLSAPLPDTLIGFVARSVLVVLVLGAIAAGFERFTILRPEVRVLKTSAATLVFGWYGIHIFWTTTYSRYALPTLPFVSILFITGCAALFKQSSKQWRPGWLGLACLITLFYGHADAEFIQRASSYQPMWRPPEMTSQWIRENVPQQAVFLYVKPSELYLYTGHPSFDDQNAKNLDHFRYLLLTKGISFILSRPFRTTHADYNVWKQNQLWAASRHEFFKAVYKNPEEATIVYQVIANPRFVTAYDLYREAAHDFDSSALSEGLKKLDQALLLDPQLVSALNAYGAGCLLSGRDPKIAEARLKEAIRLQPNHALALFNLARVYKRNGRPGLAKHYLEQAIEAARTSPEYKTWLPAIEHGV